ncbi:DUF4258 domain-containing protein [Desulfobacterales bacterium HSG2]|nr:DUF4258 domain-containing protein [Desulfobacterales bacterium HSG2]
MQQKNWETCILDVENIRKLVEKEKYQFSKHAEQKREIHMIRIWELETALRNCEIIEDYPDDPRGPSCLVLGFCGARLVHIVCTIKEDIGELLLITLYDPSGQSHKWTEDYRERR